MPTVLVPLAEGCEELEAITVTDLLRRGEVTVITAGLDKRPVCASRGAVLVPDTTLDEVMDARLDMIVLPGGLPGADHLNNDERIHTLLKRLSREGKYTCAICAAPIILAKAGLLAGKRATSYPGILEKMAPAGVALTGAAVEVDGTVITSRGPGTAMDFALTLLEVLQGSETREKVEAGLVRD